MTTTNRPYFKTDYVFQYQPTDLPSGWSQIINIYAPTPLPLHLQDDAIIGIDVACDTGHHAVPNLTPRWTLHADFIREKNHRFSLRDPQFAKIDLDPTALHLNILKSSSDALDWPQAGSHRLKAIFAPRDHTRITAKHRQYLDEHYTDYLGGTDICKVHNICAGYFIAVRPRLEQRGAA